MLIISPKQSIMISFLIIERYFKMILTSFSNSLKFHYFFRSGKCSFSLFSRFSMTLLGTPKQDIITQKTIFIQQQQKVFILSIYLRYYDTPLIPNWDFQKRISFWHSPDFCKQKIMVELKSPGPHDLRGNSFTITENGPMTYVHEHTFVY